MEIRIQNLRLLLIVPIYQDSTDDLNITSSLTRAAGFGDVGSDFQPCLPVQYPQAI